MIIKQNMQEHFLSHSTRPVLPIPKSDKGAQKITYNYSLAMSLNTEAEL